MLDDGLMEEGCHVGVAASEGLDQGEDPLEESRAAVGLSAERQLAQDDRVSDRALGLVVGGLDVGLEEEGEEGVLVLKHRPALAAEVGFAALLAEAQLRDDLSSRLDGSALQGGATDLAVLEAPPLAVDVLNGIEDACSHAMPVGPLVAVGELGEEAYQVRPANLVGPVPEPVALHSVGDQGAGELAEQLFGHLLRPSLAYEEDGRDRRHQDPQPVGLGFLLPARLVGVAGGCCGSRPIVNTKIGHREHRDRMSVNTRLGDRERQDRAS